MTLCNVTSLKADDVACQKQCDVTFKTDCCIQTRCYVAFKADDVACQKQCDVTSNPHTTSRLELTEMSISFLTACRRNMTQKIIFDNFYTTTKTYYHKTSVLCTVCSDISNVCPLHWNVFTYFINFRLILLILMLHLNITIMSSALFSASI